MELHAPTHRLLVKRILVSTLRAPFFYGDQARGGTWSKKSLPWYFAQRYPWWINKRGIFVLFSSTFVFQKIRKNRTRCRPLQKWRTLVPQVWTQELRSWKMQKQGRFSSICIVYLCAKYWHIICTKPTIPRLILNSGRVFKNRLYFMVKKSNFVAFFKDTLSLRGITPNHLR